MPASQVDAYVQRIPALSWDSSICPHTAPRTPDSFSIDRGSEPVAVFAVCGGLEAPAGVCAGGRLGRVLEVCLGDVGVPPFGNATRQVVPQCCTLVFSRIRDLDAVLPFESFAPRSDDLAD